MPDRNLHPDNPPPKTTVLRVYRIARVHRVCWVRRVYWVNYNSEKAFMGLTAKTTTTHYKKTTVALSPRAEGGILLAKLLAERGDSACYVFLSEVGLGLLYKTELCLLG